VSQPSGRRVCRAIAAIAVGLAIGTGAVAPADAQPRTVQSDVTVEVDRDGQTRARARLRIARTSASDVAVVNRAYAGARCEDCRAVAVSFQVVLAQRGPTQISADNAAFAVNEECERCDTVAIAYQFVVAGSGRSQLTPAGHRSLASVRAALQELSRSGLPAADLGAQADALAGEVSSVLTSELRSVPTVRRQIRSETRS
jgi:hypothetical protein